jgi:hypothetical protein
MLPMLWKLLFSFNIPLFEFDIHSYCGWEGGAGKRLFFEETVKRTLKTAEVGEFIFNGIF